LWGCAPILGAQPRSSFGAGSRRGKAATAHRAAEPQQQTDAKQIQRQSLSAHQAAQPQEKSNLQVNQE